MMNQLQFGDDLPTPGGFVAAVQFDSLTTLLGAPKAPTC